MTRTRSRDCVPGQGMRQSRPRIRIRASGPGRGMTSRNARGGTIVPIVREGGRRFTAPRTARVAVERLMRRVPFEKLPPPWCSNAVRNGQRRRPGQRLRAASIVTGSRWGGERSHPPTRTPGGMPLLPSRRRIPGKWPRPLLNRAPRRQARWRSQSRKSVEDMVTHGKSPPPRARPLSRGATGEMRPRL